jgi:hypothetical protein
MPEFDEKYKDVTIKGSHFPYKAITSDKRISFSKEMMDEYIPLIAKVMADEPKGFRLLLIIMANKEGFYRGTRSYKTHNPGNIGNTDSGSSKKLENLKDGVLLQKSYVLRIVNGQSKTYPMNKKKVIPPYFSPEIAKNVKNYGMSPWLPGYEFVFTGQIDQFVKIYSTGARAGNSYVSEIISFFKNHGITITSESKIQDLIKMQ